MKPSPLQAAKKRFDITENDPAEARKQVKTKLVEAVRSVADAGDLWVDRLNEDKGLEHVSNKKLLRLLETFEAVKGFGGRDKVIAAIVAGEGRDKDKFYKAHFAEWSTKRLWDHYQGMDSAPAAEA